MTDGHDDPDDPNAVVAKPDEFVALHGVTEELFETLRRWFDVPAQVSLDLTSIDSAVREMGEPQKIAALAMRKLQALHLLSTPGVRTTTDVVVTITQDLDRALVQAPVMRLKVRAASTDWDRELSMLAEGGSTDDADAAVPRDATEGDAEAERFRTLHAALHVGMMAVIEASEGEIRVLE
jgi:hypothetical protein